MSKCCTVLNNLIKKYEIIVTNFHILYNICMMKRGGNEQFRGFIVQSKGLNQRRPVCFVVIQIVARRCELVYGRSQVWVSSQSAMNVLQQFEDEYQDFLSTLEGGRTKYGEKSAYHAAPATVSGVSRRSKYKRESRGPSTPQILQYGDEQWLKF